MANPPKRPLKPRHPVATEGASSAEEMATTAGELAKLADVLDKTVAKFRLSNGLG